jgi:adenosine deaminase CECR1
MEPLLRFKERVEQLGLDIPFIFHAGETLGDGTHADMNLYDAILLGTKRIGHAYAQADSALSSYLGLITI